MKKSIFLCFFYFILSTFCFSQGSKIYWSDGVTPGVFKSNIDVTQIDTLVIGKILIDPYELTIDATNRKIYIADRGTKKIYYCNLDGSSFTSIIEGDVLVEPRGLVIDPTNKKLYWTDLGVSKILRSNLDGTNIEEIVSNRILEPHGIAIDSFHQKIYWADRLAKKIQRANLDGSDIETLISEGLNNPGGIELDLVNNKMYWTDSANADRIMRANLDGTDMELLITALNTPFRIRPDVENDKLYFSDFSSRKIVRTTLDGFDDIDVLNILDGLQGPTGLFLFDETIGNINPVSTVQKVSLFPNPSSDYVIIQNMDALIFSPQHLEIYNASGKKINTFITSRTNNNEIKIEFNTLASGVYFLKFTSNNNSFHGSFIKI